MQYVLYRKNLQQFISYTDTGKVERVSALEEAHIFSTPNEARNARKKATKKTAYFCVYAVMENDRLEKVSDEVPKRKSFSKEERMQIYRKTKGCCYLCGEFVDFDKFEIEHKVPLSKGGTNSFSNLYCACHIDNAIKHDIYPEDFMERISKIFVYQMGIRNGKGLKWKILHRILKGMV